MKKISIIIPVYNKFDTIINTLESIKKQTFKNYEIIIVDDGSTDKSLDIIKNYFNTNRNIVYKIIKQKNEGVSVARNNAINNSCGEYIFFLDGDDEIEENALEKLLANMYNNEIDFSICGYNVYQDDILVNYNRNCDTRVYNNIDFLKLFITSKIHVYMGNALYKSKIIKDKKIQFDNKYKYNEDQIFIYKYLLNCNKIFFDASKLFTYIRCESSVTMKANNERLSNVQIFIDFEHYLNDMSFNKKESIIDILKLYKIPYSIVVAITNLIELDCDRNHLESIISQNRDIMKNLKNFRIKYGKKIYLKAKIIQYSFDTYYYYLKILKHRRK